jgi:hypothetical protein
MGCKGSLGAGKSGGSEIRLDAMESSKVQGHLLCRRQDQGDGTEPCSRGAFQ